MTPEIACAAVLLRLGSVEHDLTTRTLIMGVLEGPGDRADFEGADIIEVSGAPGRSEAGEDEELERVVPLVQAVRTRFSLPVAVNTWRASVLAACAQAGAGLGHDRTGFLDPDYLPTAARLGVTVIATHSRPISASPLGTPPNPKALVDQVRAFLAEQVDRAREAGLADSQILVDAGLDLGKSPAQSLTLLRYSASLADFGPALLLGGSPGRYLGALLGLETDERRIASHAATALGISRGARVVRTHDVRGTKRVANVLEAVLRARLAQVQRSWTPPEVVDG